MPAFFADSGGVADGIASAMAGSLGVAADEVRVAEVLPAVVTMLSLEAGAEGSGEGLWSQSALKALTLSLKLACADISGVSPEGVRTAVDAIRRLHRLHSRSLLAGDALARGEVSILCDSLQQCASIKESMGALDAAILAGALAERGYEGPAVAVSGVATRYELLVSLDSTQYAESIITATETNAVNITAELREQGVPADTIATGATSLELFPEAGGRPASESSGGGGGVPIVPIAAAIGGLFVLGGIVAAVLRSRGRGGGARRFETFDNDMHFDSQNGFPEMDMGHDRDLELSRM